MVPLVFDPALVQAEEERLTTEALAGWCDQYPDVLVRRRVVHGPTDRVLTSAGVSARLVLIGGGLAMAITAAVGQLAHLSGL
jgi:hypothetical protein